MKNFYEYSWGVFAEWTSYSWQNDGTIPGLLSIQSLYAKKKATKYGIKVYGLVDVTSNYVFNFEIFAGQQPEGNFWISNLLTDVIIRMIDPIRNSGRAITADNYFTSLSLFWAIREEHGLQTVRTVNKKQNFRTAAFLSH